MAVFLHVAEEVDMPVSYVKLHGTLYHAVEQDDVLAAVTLRHIIGSGISIGIFSLAGGTLGATGTGGGDFSVGRGVCGSWL